MFSSTAGLWIATRCRRNITIPDFMRPSEILRHSNFPGHGCRSPSLHVIGVVAIGYTASIALMREAYPRKMLWSFHLLPGIPIGLAVVQWVRRLLPQKSYNFELRSSGQFIVRRFSFSRLTPHLVRWSFGKFHNSIFQSPGYHSHILSAVGPVGYGIFFFHYAHTWSI